MRLGLDAVSVRYGARAAVEPTTVEAEGGAVLGLIGPNGAGKSSLLKAIAGLVPAGGRLDLDGARLDALDERARARTIAYLPQSPAAHWPIRVRELVALGRLPHRTFSRKPAPHDVEAVEWALARTDTAALAARGIDELSGGEHARVQLARALAVRAPVLLVDEPVAALDPYHQLRIMHELGAYAADGHLVLAVLHDLTLAARFCGRLLLMHEGQVVADGEPERVLRGDTLRRYYRVEAILSRHDGQPLVVPWHTTQ